MKTARVEGRSAKRITYSTTNVNTHNDGCQNVSTATMLTLTYCQRSRANNCDRVHNCTGMVTLNVRIVTKGTIYKCSGGTVASQISTKDLRFSDAPSLFDKAL